MRWIDFVCLHRNERIDQKDWWKVAAQLFFLFISLLSPFCSSISLQQNPRSRKKSLYYKNDSLELLYTFSKGLELAIGPLTNKVEMKIVHFDVHQFLRGKEWVHHVREKKIKRITACSGHEVMEKEMMEKGTALSYQQSCLFRCQHVAFVANNKVSVDMHHSW